MSDRADLFRKRALDAQTKASASTRDESRRAWMIVARDWTKMADKEDAKASPAETPSLAAPSSTGQPNS